MMCVQASARCSAVRIYASPTGCPTTSAGSTRTAAAVSSTLRCRGVTVVCFRAKRVAALVLDRPPVASVEVPENLLAAAALALENERLRRALKARLDEEQALRRVATSVARQHAPQEALELVAEE